LPILTGQPWSATQHANHGYSRHVNFEILTAGLNVVKRVPSSIYYLLVQTLLL